MGQSEGGRVASYEAIGVHSICAECRSRFADRNQRHAEGPNVITDEFNGDGGRPGIQTMRRRWNYFQPVVKWVVAAAFVAVVGFWAWFVNR